MEIKKIMPLSQEAFVQVSQDQEGYKVHHATERNLGDIHQPDGKLFIEAVGQKIFKNNAGIATVIFKEEAGVTPLPEHRVLRMS